MLRHLFFLFVLCCIQLIFLDSFVESKEGDLITMGKCSTIVKTGKKKKDLIVMGGGCKKEKKSYHEIKMHSPIHVVKHEKPKMYIKHEHVMHKPRYGGIIYDHGHYGQQYGQQQYKDQKYEEIHHYHQDMGGEHKHEYYPGRR